MPEHPFLETWAASPTQQHEAWLVFSDDEGQAWESVHLKAAYCVHYREDFRAGAVGDGAYACLLLPLV